MKNTARRTFLKQAGYSAIGISILPFLTHCKTANNSEPGGPVTLARASPESQGVTSQAILDFLQAANQSGLEWHSFMLVRHGKVIAEGWWEPFAPDFKHTLYSLSKSFTSTAVGLAIGEGKLKLEDKIVSFFPEHVPAEMSENLRTMNIHHLLTMNTGHDTDSFGPILQKFEEPWIPTFLSLPVEHAPGTKFVYNTGATYLLSAIVQKVTGEPLEVYLKPRLFDPLGITDYDWEKSPEGINTGGFGLRVNTEAIARFGQLYLQNGQWEGKQLIPAEWVQEAVKKQTDSNPGDSEWSQGYGYQFWRCKPEMAYRGDGAYGQYCIVLPKYDAVIAVTSESWDMGKSMEVMFDTLLPAFSEVALEENTADWEKLQEAAAGLQLPVPKGAKTSETAELINGKSFQLDENAFGIKELRFHFAGDQCTLDCIAEETTHSLTAGLEQWRLSEDRPTNPFPVFFRTSAPSKIAATATWPAPDTLQLKLKFVEGIHGDRYTCQFTDKTVEMAFLNSVAEHDGNERNAERREVLRGRMVG